MVKAFKALYTKPIGLVELVILALHSYESCDMQQVIFQYDG